MIHKIHLSKTNFWQTVSFFEHHVAHEPIVIYHIESIDARILLYERIMGMWCIYRANRNAHYVGIVPGEHKLMQQWMQHIFSRIHIAHSEEEALAIAEHLKNQVNP